MKKILVASKNPVKVNGALNGFRKMFPGEQFKVKGLSITSGVSDQPLSDKETFKGALNRAAQAQKKYPSFNYYIGIEGGIQNLNGEFTAFAWIIVKSGQKIGKGRSAAFFLPKQAKDLIRKGKELGEAMDVIFKQKNIKQKNGAIGLLTGNVINRTQLYTEATIIALIPFKQKDLYNK